MFNEWKCIYENWRSSGTDRIKYQQYPVLWKKGTDWAKTKWAEQISGLYGRGCKAAEADYSISKDGYATRKIACVLDGQNSLEEMVQQQLLELQHKQQEIQGSMDLWRKLVADHAYDGQNIDFYLSYVKEEEKKGHRFAELEELVCDFSEYSEFYKVSGDPLFQLLFHKVRNQKVFLWGWFGLWIAISLFFVIEFGLGDGRMPLLVRAFVLGLVPVLLWYDFFWYCKRKRHP